MKVVYKPRFRPLARSIDKDPWRQRRHVLRFSVPLKVIRPDVAQIVENELPWVECGCCEEAVLTAAGCCAALGMGCTATLVHGPCAFDVPGQ
eukprot:CAMPEP_0206264710 /NCGR_PEP_ID=MMETSP0047_2-20121206/29562_1 /ASSEMBLY_ACC=CAM_ASM_000192 /TAXON_ID=195065 /ORGANISM="Chroomonas mesostigmatica_cf, Strain CCMP1168" /LENGTH=91 /DNA_ID=CAMNT_0053692467 /DNA_START=401 /DNA_END=677 /DNA_ORIENTATION=+